MLEVGGAQEFKPGQSRQLSRKQMEQLAAAMDATALDRERIVRVTWGEPRHAFPIEIRIRAYDRQGLMNDISQVLSNENINLKDIKINVTHNLASLQLVIEIADIAQLSRILSRIENLPNVMEAHRVNPG